MKKILLFTSIILLAFSIEVYAQHPTNLQATNITASSVDLSWDGTMCNNGFYLRYRDTTVTQWTTITTGVTMPYFLFGLSSGTTYEFSVKCIGTSGWASSVLFATFNTPEIDTAFISQPILCNGGFATDTMQIEINQTAPPTDYKCVAGYFPGGSSLFIAFKSTGIQTASTTNLSGFLPNVDYFVRIVDSIPYYNATGGTGTGSSTVGVWDQFGPINFSEPAQLVATTSVVASNQCAGDCVAAEDLTISGGTGPFSFTLNGGTPIVLPAGDSTYSFTGLCAGQYDIVVTDANGCSTIPSTTTFNISPISPIVPAGSVSVFNMNGYHVSCNGANDGTITANASGGTGAFTYSIDGNNFQSNALFTGLIAGNYTITYKDSNNCTTTESHILNEPPALSGAANVTQVVDCFGASTGAITFNVDVTQPGVPTYQYSTDDGSNYQSSNVFSNLLGNITYDVMIEDNNGCQYTSSVYLAEPAQIIYSPVLSNYNGFEITCNGAADGFIDFGVPIGGTAPLEYSIDNGSNYSSATIFTLLVAESYDLIIRDSNFCTEPMTVVLEDPGIFTIPATVTNPISCFADCNGTVAINPDSAVGQVVYTLDAGAQQTTPSFSGLCGDITNPTTYVIDATDDNGCIAQETVSLSEPTDFVYSPLTSTDEYCLQSNGTASINVTSGGTGGYLYSWNDGQTSAIATGLIAGNYHVTVTDGNGCTLIENISVGTDIGFTVSFTTVEPCLGPSSGSATVSATGMSPYTYVWSDGSGVISGANTATLSNIAIGTYTVVVEDATTCQVTGTVDVNAPVNPIQIDSLIITGNSCFGINDAQIEILSSGGQSPYSYSNTGGLNTQTNPVFSNLSPGSYTIRAIDANGCYAQSIDTLSYPGQLVIDSTVFTHISCFGEDDGAIQDIIFTGGTAPFEYTIDGGVPQSYPLFNDLEPGWHTVEIADINNGVNGITCETSDLIYISEPTLLNAVLTPSDSNNYQVLCNGGSSGYLDVEASGGTLPYYTIHMNASPYPDTTFGAISQITGLSQGNHTFIVEDANGCAHTETIMYNEPAPIGITFSTTHVSCVAWSNGAATAIVSGGVGTATSYTYQWSDANGIITGATTYSIDGLSAGDYNIEVTDVHGCINDNTVTINDNDALRIVANASVTNVGCYGECDGEITINVSGGVPFTPPAPTLNTLYNYQWNDYLNQTTNPAVGLCADSVSNTQEYICVITDAQGCELYDTVTLSQPEEFSVATEITSVISCNGNSDGKIKASITGGTPMFTYTWGNGSSQNTNNTTNIITGLPEGQYIVDVVDNNGCMASSSIYLGQPDSLQVSINAFDIDCNGAGTGSLTALAIGGTPFLGIPPEYEYTWIDENGTTILTELVNNNVNAQLSDLAPGFYTVKVTDLNGCSVISEVVSIIEPTTALELIVEAHDEECSTSAFATAFPAGGTGPYTYEWSNGNTLQTAADLLAESNTPYTVTVTDNSGCEISENITVLGFQYVLLPNSLNYIDTTICLGQSVNIDIAERPGLTYSWNDGVLTGDRIISPDTVLAFNQNLSETYILTITDENNCSQDVMVDVSTSSVDAMPASNPGVEYGKFPVVLSGESIEIYSDNNNCQNYTWTWSLDTINEKSTVISPENTSWYYINVEDSDGCLGYDSIYVVVGVKPYEAITPNGDKTNDSWIPLDIESYENALVQVFNRWGGLVFESKGGTSYNPWDGTNPSNGKELPVGTYYYIIDLNTGDAPQTGPITIIR